MITQLLVSVCRVLQHPHAAFRRFLSLRAFYIGTLHWTVANWGLANGSQTSLHTCSQSVLDHVNYEHEDSLAAAVSL